MAARIAWLLNLDADRELQDPDGYRASRVSAERLREARARIADLVAAEDLILDDLSRDELRLSRTNDLTLQAFCPTPSACQRIAALGLPLPPAPALAILREVNDRGFCAALGHGLDQSCFARDMQTLEQHLARPSPTTRYVIKRAFSFAGREQRRVLDGRLDDSTRGFCLRSFARGEGLQVEPWVERIADFSNHGYLTRGGATLFGPAREQRCDPMGRFLGMSTASAAISADEEELLAGSLRETATALAAAGYFGPFGIDAFRYRAPDGDIGFNARCEINARFTLGYPRSLLLEALALE